MRNLRTIFQPKLLMALAAMSGCLVAWPLVRASLPNLKERPAYQLSHNQISVNEPPFWVPHNFLNDATLLSGLPAEMSILDTKLTSKVARAFAHHPWVAEVNKVQKASYPPRVMVTLEYRVPVAMIEKPTGLFPVDSKGVLLPAEDFSLSESANYLLIKGVRSTPPSMPGEIWNDPLVHGASQIALKLQTNWQEFDLKSIRVPVRTKDKFDVASAEYLLETEAGSLILWGHATPSTSKQFLNADQKISRLKKYITDHGNFDTPAGPYEIDIRHWQQISRKQLP